MLKYNTLLALIACFVIVGLTWTPSNADSSKGLLKLSTHDVAELTIKEDLVLGSQYNESDFGEVVGVVVDSHGAIHVLDRGFSCVHKYSHDGTYIIRYGSEGDGPGEFRNPTAIGIDNSDRVFVASMGSQVSIYSASDGSTLGAFNRDDSSLDAPVFSIAVDRDGFIYLTGISVLQQRVIFKYSPIDYKFINSFGSSFAIGSEVDTRTERVFGGGYIDINNSNEIIYSQRVPPKVMLYNTEGQLLHQLETRGFDLDIPEPRIEGSTITFYTPELMSGPIFSLDGGLFITTVISNSADNNDDDYDRKIYLDICDSQGRVIQSLNRLAPFYPMYSDNSNRLYVAEVRGSKDDEYPVIVRYSFDSDAFTPNHER